ncbi:MAG: SDR family NAD(P)-dependent oxidoreductase [Desulfobacterales bacterium]|jgi:NAD(P)-dependent dehydrogenase (short-subunit alcohol dehydrogenase family)
MAERVKDKVSIVTGAAQGMGLAIATALFNEGAKVTLVDISEKTVKDAAQQLDPTNKRTIGAVVDVTKRDQVCDFVSWLKSEWGRIDILVNNAGGALHTPHRLEEIKEKDWDLVLDVNLKGAFFFCQAVIPEMVKQEVGAIVNMSALAAHWRASLAGVQYVAAKAGLEGLTRQLAYDWGKQGIRVNAVAPTVTLTGDRVRGLWEQKSSQEQEKVLAAIPLGRLSTPQEIAAVVVFLASEDAGYITGITVDVCGGRYLR